MLVVRPTDTVHTVPIETVCVTTFVTVKVGVSGVMLTSMVSVVETVELAGVTVITLVAVTEVVPARGVTVVVVVVVVVRVKTPGVDLMWSTQKVEANFEIGGSSLNDEKQLSEKLVSQIVSTIPMNVLPAGQAFPRWPRIGFAFVTQSPLRIRSPTRRMIDVVSVSADVDLKQGLAKDASC